jgi:hypothetical protein
MALSLVGLYYQVSADRERNRFRQLILSQDKVKISTEDRGRINHQPFFEEFVFGFLVLFRIPYALL